MISGGSLLSVRSWRDPVWQGAIALSNTGIATSGDYRNYFEVEGVRYSHLIDPRTGYPIRHDLVSVTVIHPSTGIADALGDGPRG